MIRVNLARGTAGLRYFQAKRLLRGRQHGLYLEYRRVGRGRNLVVGLPGPKGQSIRPWLPDLMKKVSQLADKTRTRPSYYFKGTDLSMRFRFNMRGARTYGGRGAFKGQGRGWRRLLKHMRVKN